MTLEGELGFAAGRVLMKALWLGRLARPDLVKPIGDLASFVQKWSRNCDKQLHRLVCYINSTVNDCCQRVLLHPKLPLLCDPEG